MKVVIFCGGRGTRLSEETEFRPKPLMPIGGRPILWHIMKHYAHHGHKEFILCLGYKGHMIKEYFRDYLWHGDVTVFAGGAATFHRSNGECDWMVSLIETGADSGTGHRLRMAATYLRAGEDFLLTYGDGLSDVDIKASIAAHRESKKLLTLTAVHPPGRFGMLNLGDGLAGGLVGGVAGGHRPPLQGFQFEEKAREPGWANGGFMVCNQGVLDYLTDPSPDLMFEHAPLGGLVDAGQVHAFRHEGFWQCMDTPQEWQLLNRLWDSSQAKWKVWGEKS